MRRARTIAIAGVALATTLAAYASVGNGDIRATTGVTTITVTTPTGSGSGTATLENTSTNTTYSVQVGSSATCDPDMSFVVTGGNPAALVPSATRNVQITCPPRDTAAMLRCRYHATNNLNGAALADFWGVCLYGANPPTLTPLQTSLDFGNVAVGSFTQQTLTIRNDGGGAAIKRVYLQTTDLDGNFQFAAPCNPDAAFCDEYLPSAIAPGGTLDLGIRCRPQSPGTHTANVLVGTDTFQLLSLGVTLTCNGTPTTGPALAIEPTTVTIPAPVEVLGADAQVTIHLENAGGATLLIRDVRVVEVDPDAAEDWTYTASGTCSGQISSMCSLAPGARVELDVTFDPTAIGARRATLLVSYRDTIDRTLEVPLEGSGLGATVRRLGASALTFGTVPVGSTAQLDVALGNDGNRDASVMLELATGTSPPFSLAPASMTTIAPATPRMVSLSCTPMVAGSFTTTMTAEGTDTVSSGPIAITATCEGTTQELHATPASLMLGELRTTSAPMTYTVQLQTVDAGTPLTLDGQPTLEQPNANITLGPLSQLSTPATFDVTVTPQSEASLAATIVVSSTSGETVRIPIAASIVEASYQVPPMLDLGTFCVDQPTTSSSAALLSDGNATIELMPPVLAQSPSAFQIGFSRPPVYPYPLGANQSASVSVTPLRQRTAMTVTDALTWRTDVAGTPTATTGLTARFIDSGGAIAPPALGFGEVTVHLFTDNGQRVVIQNCNPTPLVLDPPMIRTPFSIDSPNFPAMLNPNERVAFSVGFHPTRKGLVTDVLRITSPQLPGAPLEVTLTGIGGPLDPATPDAGVDVSPPGDTSFYDCNCRSSRPGGGLPVLVVLIALLRPRRRPGGIG